MTFFFYDDDDDDNNLLTKVAAFLYSTTHACAEMEGHKGKLSLLLVLIMTQAVFGVPKR